MAATERRMGLSRRGMTILGKVPVAPKPINLPSQRLENQGLFPDVEIVPRGPCWGRAGRFPGAGGSKAGKSDSASLKTASCGGERENGGKVESKPFAPTGSKNFEVNDGDDLLENPIKSSSANSRTNPSSAGATTTAQALNSIRKMEEPRNSSSYTCNPSDSRKQETADPSLQRSGDGYVRGVSVPPGFGHCGPHDNHSRAGVSPSEFQHNGVGAGMYSNTSQQNGLPSFQGMPYRSGTKDREIIVIHMVGSPGFYGNYPPQFGYPENYSRNGMYGNFPLQFGNFEPYFGLQGHGRLDGGAQISCTTSSDLFDEHEDFICYEKECYKGACHELGRHKNGWARGSHRESTFLGGVQRDVHEALISGSTSALKSRSISQKHLSRNAGRVKSMYRNGRVVSFEASSAVPVPEKRITLLTKVSQHEMLTNTSPEGTGLCEVAHARSPVGSVSSACLNKEGCEDEGKAPIDTLEAGKVIEDAQAKRSLAAGASVSLETVDEINLPKETEKGSKEALEPTTTCNDKCLHFKAEAAVLEAPATLVCQASKKTTVCESSPHTLQCCLRPTEELAVASIENSNGVDGCKVEAKHVISDADSHSMNTLKGQEDSSLEAAAVDRQVETLSSTEPKSSSRQEETQKKMLLGKKNIDKKWKPKRPAGAAKVDFKVFAPKVKKAVTEKAPIQTSASECVSKANCSPANCNKKVPSSNTGADSTTLLSQTETCKMQCQKDLLTSSLSSSGAASVDDSHETSSEKPNGAASADCIASDRRHFQKKKGKNIHKTTLHNDYQDNMAAVHPVEIQESSMKTFFEGISSTDDQKQEAKGVDNRNEKVWKPKMPTSLKSKLTTKASGVHVNKAHVIPRKLGLRGKKSHSVVCSTFSTDPEEPIEDAKKQEDAVQGNNSLSTSQSCNSQVLKTDISQLFEAASKKNAGRQQNFLFRKRSAEEAALGHQISRNSSNNNQHISLFSASPNGKFGTEHAKQGCFSASWFENNLKETGFYVSASKYHMIRRRVYHVVDGSEEDYYVPSAPLSGELHRTGKHGSHQINSMQQPKQSQAKIMYLSSGSSHCTESEHSEESLLLPDSMCGIEIKPCRSWSKDIPHLEQQAGVVLSKHPSSLGSENSELRKHVKPGKHSSAWKPKVAAEIAVLENNFSREENESGNLTPSRDEGAWKENTGSLTSSQAAAASVSNVHTEKNSEKRTGQNLPLEPESVSFQPVEIKQICSQESTSGNRRPFFKKSNVMNYEKADRFHQLLFKKYKPIGQWKPKGDLHNQVLESMESGCASQDDIEPSF